MGLQGANHHLFETMAAALLLYLSRLASTASVSSSLISERGEEGCLALFITLTSILFIILVLWAFNRCSGKKEKFGLKMVRDDNGLYHIGRRDLSYFNGCSGLSANHVLMSSLPMKSCITSEVVPANILKLHIAHNEIHYVHKEYNTRKRKMTLKRLLESQELMSDLMVAMSRRGKLEKNSLAIKILVELNHYRIPSSMGIEGRSSMIITTRERSSSQYHITEMEVEIKDERSLTTILSRKVESLIFTIEELLNCFQSHQGWTVSGNGRNELLIDIRVHRFDQTASLEMRAIGYDSQTRNDKRLSISAPIFNNHYMVPTISFFARASIRNLGRNLSLCRIGMIINKKQGTSRFAFFGSLGSESLIVEAPGDFDFLNESAINCSFDGSCAIATQSQATTRSLPEMSGFCLIDFDGISRFEFFDSCGDESLIEEAPGDFEFLADPAINCCFDGCCIEEAWAGITPPVTEMTGSGFCLIDINGTSSFAFFGSLGAESLIEDAPVDYDFLAAAAINCNFDGSIQQGCVTLTSRSLSEIPANIEISLVLEAQPNSSWSTDGIEDEWLVSTEATAWSRKKEKKQVSRFSQKMYHLQGRSSEAIHDTTCSEQDE